MQSAHPRGGIRPAKGMICPRIGSNGMHSPPCGEVLSGDAASDWILLAKKNRRHPPRLLSRQVISVKATPQRRSKATTRVVRVYNLKTFCCRDATSNAKSPCEDRWRLCRHRNDDNDNGKNAGKVL